MELNLLYQIPSLISFFNEIFNRKAEIDKWILKTSSVQPFQNSWIRKNLLTIVEIPILVVSN